MTKFQKEFKKLRTEYNMTQAELAKALNVSRSTIGMYEQGKREPDFETLEKISDYFNVSMSVFLEDQMTDCDLYSRCYHQKPYDIVQKFLSLDSNDRLRIEERIDFLLEDSKYHQQHSNFLLRKECYLC